MTEAGTSVDQPPTRETTPAAGGLSRSMVILLAVSCGVAVASLYYAQPLLHTIAGEFHTGSATAGLIVTLSQIGYAAGLALVVPVGDIAPRRRLVPWVLLIAAVALALSAAAVDIGMLIVLAFFVGLGAVAAQILIPFAASSVGEERRGRVVGTIMSGLLLGILLARTVSGVIAGATSWRVVFGVAAGSVLVLAVVLARALPVDKPRPHLPYRELLRSTVQVFVRDPVLRRRSLYGALGMAGFSIFWTTVAFLLAGPPYHYSETVIGLFGLAGAAGALCATFAGRLADRGWAKYATRGFAALILLSWLPLWVGGHHVAWLVVGIVLLDIGVQGTQVTNQSVMYATGGQDRSRANAAYMVCYFAGGGAGSAIAAAVYASGGWPAVSGLGAGVAALGLLATTLERSRARRVVLA
jgi:predicted MFS family arabinose efflux permease